MKKLILQLLLLVQCVTFAQSYHFLNLTVEDGLSQNEVYELIQDKRGAIWMATQQGITIYNGVNFSYLNTESGLPSNIIYSLYEDVKGHIWIGTHKGLTVYDGTDFRTYTAEDGLPSNIVKTICEDGFGRLWIGTQYGGLCMLDNFSKEKKSFVPYNIDFGRNSEQLSINKVIETPDAKIYIGTNRGLAEIFNGKIKTYDIKDGLFGRNIYDLQEDINGDIWLATSSGLALFNGTRFKNFSTSNGYPIDAALTIAEDKNSNIWVGTSRNGVVRLNINTFEYEVYNSDKGLSEDIVLSILEDKNDNIWVGTKGGGINKFKGISFTYFGEKEGLQNEKINGLIQDSEDNFWFATRGGLIRYNGVDSFELYNRKSGLPVDYTTVVYEDKDETIWVGTLIGLAKIVDNKIEKVFSIRDGIVNPVTCIFEDADGTLWIGTEGGLGKYDGEKFRFFRMIDGMNQGKISSITQDKTGKLWIGTQGGGVNWFNGIEFGYLTEEDGLVASNFVNCMVRGPRGGIYIGTKKGITQFDETSNTYHTFNTQTSKLSSNNIKMLIFDEDNQLWAGSDKGLDRITFNPPQITRQTGEHISEIKHFGKSDGIIGGEVNGNAVCEDFDGNLWFGTNKGAIKLDRTIDYSSDLAPVTYFTGLLLNNQKTDWRTRNYDVMPWSGMPENLVLPYDSSSITFEFVGINHDNPKNTQYYWYLKGFEEKRYIPEKALRAKYTKLPPGEYTFEVYACNKDDICSDQNPSTFSFVVSPPFWQELWFIVLVVLLVVLSIVGIVKNRERKLRAERELLEQKVKERTQEVTEKNKELELVNLEVLSKNKEIEQKNNDLNSSIRYALTIQKASFPAIQAMKHEVPNSFIYHLPRDIVSGDFYWYRKTNNKFVVACADCTGHGVPGALTSMIGIALLNEIVGGNKITDPAEALSLLDQGILKAFENSESETNDGMDISLITIDLETKTIEYAGAYRPLIMIRDGELTEIKATKMSIGFKDVPVKTFEKHTVQFQSGDNFYMFSDGYPDQFGGPKGKKFKSKAMKEMLISASNESMEEQKTVVHEALSNWMKNEHEQVDDILVMGIKF